MPHPDQRNMWDVEEETLCGDVGRFREATGMRQHSRCTQGEGTGHWRWRQSRLGSGLPGRVGPLPTGRMQGINALFLLFSLLFCLSSLLAGPTQSPEGKEKHCFFDLFWDRRKVGGV